MRTVLSIEDFLGIKQKFLDEIEKIEHKFGEGDDDEKTIKEFYETTYKPEMNHLLSFDLSKIDSQEWSKFPLISLDQDILDFEGTFANIDFDIIDESYIGKYNFKTCQIFGLEHSSITLDRECFDSEFVEKNTRIFLDDSFDAEFRKKFNESSIEFSDYFALTDELRDKIDREYFLTRLNSDDKFFVHSVFDIRSGYSDKDKTDKIFKFVSELGNRYKVVKNVYLYAHYNFYSYIDPVDTESFVDSLYSLVYNMLTDPQYPINYANVPNELMYKYPKLFFLDVDVNIRNKIYGRTLTLDDYIENMEILSNRVNEYHFKSSNSEVLSLCNMLSSLTDEECRTLIDNHKEFLIFSIEHNSSILRKISTIEDGGLDYKVLEALGTVSGKTSYFAIPIYFKNYKMDSFESLQTVLPNLSKPLQSFILDIVQKLKLENLIVFDKRTSGSLSKNNMSNFFILGYYMFNQNMKEFETYEEFADAVLDCIVNFNKESKNLKLDYRMFRDGLNANSSTIFLTDEEEKMLRSKKLIDKFYSFSLSIKDILANPQLFTILENKDIGLLLSSQYYKTNLIESLGNDRFLKILQIYGVSLEYVISDNVYVGTNSALEDISEQINLHFEKKIKEGKISRLAELPPVFKKSYPHFFLDSHNRNLQSLFDNRKLTPEIFDEHPEYLEYFKYTDLVVGMLPKFGNLIGLANPPFTKTQNLNKLIIIKGIIDKKLEDCVILQEFRDYCSRNIDNIDEKKIKDAIQVIRRLVHSNSEKLCRLKKEICDMVLTVDDPTSVLDKIEDIYLSNNLPDVAKIFSVFRVLHTNDGSLSLNLQSNSSPVLKAHSKNSNEIIIYSDLIKSAIESNNFSLRNYIRVLEEGEKILARTELAEYELLSGEEKRILRDYSKYLCVLYNQTDDGKLYSFTLTGDVVKDLTLLCEVFKSEASLNDSIVSMFLHFVGIDDLETLKRKMDESVSMRSSISRNIEHSLFTLEKGYLIKGLDDIKYLFQTLQNGSLSSEFLGAQASTSGNRTPLDTDLSYIKDPAFNMSATINGTISSAYGPIWIVIKKDNPNIYISRGNDGREVKHYVKDKLELFKTLSDDHYGIRTGFGSTNIDFIIADNYTSSIGLAIAMQGFYIPVVDRHGKVLFTSEMFDEYMRQMEGLSYYGYDYYQFSDTLITEEIENIANSLPVNRDVTTEKGNKIKDVIRSAVKSIKTEDGETLNFNVKEFMDGNLKSNVLEIIDIGSTGRGTNEIGDGDYDFIIRLDNNIMSSDIKLQALKKSIMEAFGQSNTLFRYKNVKLDNISSPVDIDISFVSKTDAIIFSTDMAIKDKLSTIERIDPIKYRYVVANIIYAKRVLKSYNCYYKIGHSKCVHGGLGGVGVENWILSHNGSFVEACKSFLRIAEQYTDFYEFSKKYKVWDFGENFYKKTFLHDEFVENCMSPEGYIAMKNGLRIELDRILVNSIDIEDGIDISLSKTS